MLRFDRREAAFSSGSSAVATAVVLAYAEADPWLLGSAVVLAGCSLAGGLTMWAQARAREQLMTLAVIPSALLASLVVTARVLPEQAGFIAVFWSLTAWIFNVASFRSRFLNGFLLAYLAAALVTGIAFGGGSSLSAVALVFCTGTTVFVLVFHHRVLATLEAAVNDRAREAHHARNVDPGTGMPSRGAFLGRARDLAAGSHPFTVMVFDIDRSATLRERHGEAKTSRLLRATGELIRAASRDIDMLAFSGGDRFLVLAPGAGARDDATRLAERLASQANGARDLDEQRVGVTVTAGLACFPADGATPDIVVQRAEEAVNFAKRRARGSVQAWNRTESEAVREALALEEELRGALAGGQFRLCYQPKCDRVGRVTSCEALLRWAHPSRGMVPPDRFISALERSGAIRQVGAWVLEEALRQLAAWRAEGLDDLSIAINVSPVELADPQLSERVRAALARHGIAGGQLELEITEAVLVQDVAASRDMLNQLHAIGVRISVDDFGTGYSSLVRLLELPFDIMKVDKSFVDRLGRAGEGEAVVRLVLQMARHLGKASVAEGIETKEQLDFLLAEGCDRFQGYYFARPLPPAEFLAYAQSR